MSTTPTTRYGLIKPTPGTGEIVNVADLNLNSDVIDAALGSVVVNNGTIVPSTSLRDGMIITEKTSGISYANVKNVSGTYDKSYLSYPYFYCAFTPLTLYGNVSGTFANYGWNTFYDGSVGANEAVDKVPSTNFWRCPRKGIYQIHNHVFWQNTATANQAFASVLSVGGSSELQNTRDACINVPGLDQSTDGTMTRLFQAGDIVGQNLLAGPGATPSVYTSFEATLITPVN